MLPQSGPNPLQLSALGLQAGALAGAIVAASSASAGELAGRWVSAALGIGFVGGASMGWAASLVVVPIIRVRLPSGRPQTLFVAYSASAASAFTALGVVSYFAPSPVSLLIPALVCITVGIVFGILGTAP